MVAMPACRFTAAANGTWKPSERLTGSAVERPVRPPEEQSTTSMPSAFSSLAKATVSSTSQPPAPSTAETRMNIGLCSGQPSRTARAAASGKRMRPARSPPYWSLRLLLIGERNCASR